MFGYNITKVACPLVVHLPWLISARFVEWYIAVNLLVLLLLLLMRGEI